MNLSEYAKYRNVSTEAVRLAIKGERLKTSVRDITPPGGKNKKYEIVDPLAADAEWDANTDERRRFNVKPARESDVAGIPATDRPLPMPPLPDAEPSNPIPARVDIKEAQRLETEYSARLKQLKFEQEMGRLIEADKIEAAWVKIITEAKTRLLAIPSKAKSTLPHLTLKDVAVIDRLMREALSDLSNAPT